MEPSLAGGSAAVELEDEGTVSVCDSLLSSEPIYTGGKGSAAGLYCLKDNAPAGQDGRIKEAGKDNTECRKKWPIRFKRRVMMSKRRINRSRLI